ncbi:MAG: response regulator [Ectothiorhodospiraceae bacterium]|nr:response regulator [Ectothiorhodospiraceae bacterium]
MLRSVRTKIVAAVAVVALVTLGLNAAVGVLLFKEQYTRAIQAQTLTVGRNLATQLRQLLALGIPVDELVGFDDQCRETVDAYDDVGYAMVVRPDGRVLFQDRGPAVLPSDAELRDGLAAGEETVVLVQDGSASHYDALVPVLGSDGETVAVVRIGVPVRAVTERVHALTRTSVITAIGSLGLGLVVLAVVIGRLVVRRLGRLDGAMRAIAGGRDLGATPPVPVDSHDEIGTIALAFNRMIEGLDQSRREVERYTNELEHRVLERTRELSTTNETLERDIERRRKSEAALLQARRDAVAASEAKSRFLANMSHEIRTPMNGVLGMAQLLSQTVSDPEQRGWVEVIDNSGRALLSLIDDILDFSKVEAGKMTLALIPFDLGATFREVGRLLAPKAAEKGVRLIVDYGPDVPRQIVGDPGRVRQILINLLGNALKFTEHGHVLLAAECLARSDGRVTLAIRVRDTGVGIPASALPRLFETFSQATDDTARKYGGTGLGLAITRHLVELMGGSIRVESTPGEGTAFHIQLELDVAAGSERDGGRRFDGQSALLVEANATERAVLARHLRDAGLAPEPADSVCSALAAVDGGKAFDFTLLAADLPGLDATTLTRLATAHPDGTRSTVVVLGRDPSGPDSRLSDTSVPLRFIARPFVARDLLDTMTLSPERDARDHLGSVRASSGVTPSLRGRVLVAEDVVMNQKVATAILRRLGLEVDLAEDGRQAVERWRGGQYDLVLMDCHMPEMDGYEATRRIRATEAASGAATRIPIVALTANAMPEDRAHCIQCGMDDFVAKPFSREALSKVLSRWLGPPSTDATPTAAVG